MNGEISYVTRRVGRTAAAAVPVRHRTPRASNAVPRNAVRLLRVELRRNTMPWILPLIAALFWFDSYRPSTGSAAGLPVCVNPAYRRWLPDVTAALAPVLAEVAGLPGTPVRATQVAAAYPSGGAGPPQPVTAGGSPPVLRMQLGLLNMPGPCGFCDGPVATQQFAGQIRLLFAHAFVGAGSGSGTPVQQAVQAALLRGAGIPFAAQPGLMAATGNFPGPGPGPATGPVYAAARRLATLPAAARHAWLAAHLAALRAGGLTINDLP